MQQLSFLWELSDKCDLVCLVVGSDICDGVVSIVHTTKGYGMVSMVSMLICAKVMSDLSIVYLFVL